MKKRMYMLMVLILIFVSVKNVSAISTNQILSSYYKGDVNGDWIISTADARDILINITTKDSESIVSIADYDENGIVNSTDARKVLIDVLKETTPTLVTVPATIASELPEGNTISFTQIVNLGNMVGGNAERDECYIIQSLEELQAFYTSECSASGNYVEAFTEDFFHENALVLVKIYATSAPKEVYVHQIIRDSNGCLTIHLVEEYAYGVNPIIYGGRILLEIEKDDLNNVIRIQLYEDICRDGPVI